MPVGDIGLYRLGGVDIGVTARDAVIVDRAP